MIARRKNAGNRGGTTPEDLRSSGVALFRPLGVPRLACPTVLSALLGKPGTVRSMVVAPDPGIRQFAVLLGTPKERGIEKARRNGLSRRALECGGYRARTDDLLHAMQTLSQLS